MGNLVTIRHGNVIETSQTATRFPQVTLVTLRHFRVRVAFRDSLVPKVTFRDIVRPRIALRDSLRPRVAFRDRLRPSVAKSIRLQE